MNIAIGNWEKVRGRYAPKIRRSCLRWGPGRSSREERRYRKRNILKCSPAVQWDKDRNKKKERNNYGVKENRG